jgi:hypothetical protein
MGNGKIRGILISTHELREYYREMTKARGPTLIGVLSSGA